MAKRLGPRDKEDNVAGEHTFGHNLLTLDLVKRLSECATHWAVIIHLENDPEHAPNHNLFPSAGVVSMFEQGKLCRASLLAGFKTSHSPQRPVPACFFRTLDFLLQYIEAGNSYRAINDKEDVKGFPPAGWCRPSMVTSAEDAPTVMQHVSSCTSPAELARVPANHALRFFYSARSWCHLHSLHVAASTIRMHVGVTPADLYAAYCDGQLSEYTLLLGLQDPVPPTSLWVPPCTMMTLGALLYMHDYGRPYLPVTLAELREVRNTGLFALGPRRDVRPLPLPPGVLPAPAPTIPGLEVDVVETRGSANRASGSGGASGSASGSRARGGGSTAVAVEAASGSVGSSRGGSTSASGSQGGGGRRVEAATAAAPPPPPPIPDPEPDPILNSSNWIMPQPFDAPSPSPVAAAPADGSNGGAAAASDANGGAGGTTSPANAVAALPTSPFLGELNNGVQPAFETPPLRLFLGERGQSALSSNWWFVDSETNTIRGPYSPEQMILSYVAGCRELHEETLVCGTEADVRLPMVPPAAAFLPLGGLLGDVIDGASYALVGKADMLSPLAQRFLGNRMRQPRPAAAAPAASGTTPTPVVLAVPSQPSPSPPPQGSPRQQQPTEPAAATQAYVVPTSSSETPAAAVAAPAPLVVQVMPQAVRPAAAPAPVIRALPLPLQMAGPRPLRPMAVPVAGAAGGATPAFIMPGGMMYMQQYAPVVQPQQVMPYGAVPVFPMHGMPQVQVVPHQQQQ